MLDWLKRRAPAPPASPVGDPSPAAGSPPSADANRSTQSTACRDRGNACLADGRLDDAAAAYRQAIALDPHDAEGHLNLGYVLREQRRYEDAQHHLTQAARLAPAEADAPYMLGTMHAEQGRMDAAIACFERAIALRPDFAIASRDLFRALKISGDTERARRTLLDAISRNPQVGDFHFHLGVLHADAREYDRAIRCYATALSIAPDSAQVHLHLGKAVQMQGDLATAIASYETALSLDEASFEAHNDLGVALEGLGDFERAASHLRRALDLKPDFALAANNLAVVLQAQGKTEDAIAWYGNALSIDPGYADAHANLGTLFLEQELYAEAADSMQRALELNPNAANVHANLAMVLKKIGRTDRVLACYRRALELAPEDVGTRMYYAYQAQHECAWDDLDANGREVRRAVREGLAPGKNPIHPFSFLALSGSTAQEQQLCAARWSQSRSRHANFARHALGLAFAPKSGQRLHIGYLSADFREHAVSHLMAEVFELRDRSRFRITAYACGPNDHGAMRQRLERAFDSFVDIRSDSDEVAARRIHADGVDILVDLTGHTNHTRSSIMAFRPAPVQVNYLGYPGTLGADYVDYLIADNFVIPPQHRRWYTEEVVWLPGCYLPNDRSLPSPQAASRADCGLPERGIVFCAYNQTYKITPEIFDVWCRLLNAVPDSTLWLKASNDAAGANLRREAQHRGVSPSRLVTTPQVAGMQEHLARLQCADLFLDTFPYNAHSTCRDALWVGLPVITCAGETFPSRVAGSLLTAVGSPELIAVDLDGYYELALALANDGPRRAAIRARLIAARDTSPAFDSSRFTRDLEAAYVRMWDAYAGRVAAPA